MTLHSHCIVVMAASDSILGTFQGASYSQFPRSPDCSLERFFSLGRNLGRSNMISLMDMRSLLHTYSSGMLPVPLASQNQGASICWIKQAGGGRSGCLFSIKPTENSRSPRGGCYTSPLHLSRGGRVISWAPSRILGKKPASFLCPLSAQMPSQGLASTLPTAYCLAVPLGSWLVREVLK